MIDVASKLLQSDSLHDPQGDGGTEKSKFGSVVPVNDKLPPGTPVSRKSCTILNRFSNSVVVLLGSMVSGRTWVDQNIDVFKARKPRWMLTILQASGSSFGWVGFAGMIARIWIPEPVSGALTSDGSISSPSEFPSGFDILSR